MTSILRVQKPPDYLPDKPPAMKHYRCEFEETSEQLSFRVFIVKGIH